MKLKLRCVLCKDQHAADSKHFPLELRDKKDHSIKGHICRKCVKKQVKLENREKQIDTTKKI